jgi:hypothetical protein
VRWRAESSILFSFDTDLPRRVKASRAIKLGRTVCRPAFTPAVVLFIALPEFENKTDPG